MIKDWKLYSDHFFPFVNSFDGFFEVWFLLQLHDVCLISIALGAVKIEKCIPGVFSPFDICSQCLLRMSLISPVGLEQALRTPHFFRKTGGSKISGAVSARIRLAP